MAQLLIVFVTLFAAVLSQTTQTTFLARPQFGVLTPSLARAGVFCTKVRFQTLVVRSSPGLISPGYPWTVSTRQGPVFSVLGGGVIHGGFPVNDEPVEFEVCYQPSSTPGGPLTPVIQSVIQLPTGTVTPIPQVPLVPQVPQLAPVSTVPVVTVPGISSILTGYPFLKK